MEIGFIYILAIIVFWGALLAGSFSTLLIAPLLKKFQFYKQADRKTTLYGTKAVEFEKIRKREEGATKKMPVSRVGGITFIPTLIIITAFITPALQSEIFLLAVLSVLAVTLVMLYDDLADIGVLPRKPIRIRVRLTLFSLIALLCGYALTKFLPAGLTFLPFMPFENVLLPATILALLFMLWCLFWQISSVIDGVDGLSGTIFLLLFSGTTILSVMQKNPEALLLSALSMGILFPWLYVNVAPAKAYLTETGITLLLMLFSIITFLLAVGTEGGDGLWVGILFGAVLIATWLSNILQLWYRKKTGKKLFRIAPLHHHFEALGIPGSSVVLRYMLVTFLLVIAGLSLAFLFG